MHSKQQEQKSTNSCPQYHASVVAAELRKSKGVIEKLKVFFEKYFGLGIAEFRADKQEKPVVYEIEPSYQMVAEESAPYPDCMC